MRRVRDDAQRASGELDVHARDLMMEGADVDALAHVQLVKSYWEEGIARLEQALREARADG